MVYTGPYDLKYYLDRQPSEPAGKNEKRNTHLEKGRVLVFVEFRRQSEVEIPICDVVISEKKDGQKFNVPKDSKVI